MHTAQPESDAMYLIKVWKVREKIMNAFVAGLYLQRYSFTVNAYRSKIPTFRNTFYSTRRKTNNTLILHERGLISDHS